MFPFSNHDDLGTPVRYIHIHNPFAQKPTRVTARVVYQKIIKTPFQCYNHLSVNIMQKGNATMDANTLNLAAQLAQTYNMKQLFTELGGKKLSNYLSFYAFNQQTDYAAQTPSIYPIGELHLMDNSIGRGSGQRWANADESIWVDIDRDGTIQYVSLAS